MGIPSVRWKKYKQEVQFDEDKLWTVRIATTNGDDLNLPRAVGVNSKEAKEFADKLLEKYGDNDALIIYYPYFIAKKSGTLEIKIEGYVIEAVNQDLWNLVTNGECEVTIKNNGETTEIYGDKDFLSEYELKKLLKQRPKVKGKFKDYLLEGKSILLEWSFAVNTDISGEEKGEPYLVFYECRTV